uniref:Secreted protein n=1 Tax=Globodera pallida TaxID=36090 RepID=A0A183BWN0_GLOPA
MPPKIARRFRSILCFIVLILLVALIQRVPVDAQFVDQFTSGSIMEPWGGNLGNGGGWPFFARKRRNVAWTKCRFYPDPDSLAPAVLTQLVIT